MEESGNENCGESLSGISMRWWCVCVCLSVRASLGVNGGNGFQFLFCDSKGNRVLGDCCKVKGRTFEWEK